MKDRMDTLSPDKANEQRQLYYRHIRRQWKFEHQYELRHTQMRALSRQHQRDQRETQQAESRQVEMQLPITSGRQATPTRSLDTRNTTPRDVDPYAGDKTSDSPEGKAKSSETKEVDKDEAHSRSARSSTSDRDKQDTVRMDKTKQHGLQAKSQQLESQLPITAGRRATLKRSLDTRNMAPQDVDPYAGNQKRRATAGPQGRGDFSSSAPNRRGDKTSGSPPEGKVESLEKKEVDKNGVHSLSAPSSTSDRDKQDTKDLKVKLSRGKTKHSTSSQRQ